MNPALKEIFKEELHKLLDAQFIYPISESQWVSPLVIVPKKNGKCCICVDYCQNVSLGELDITRLGGCLTILVHLVVLWA
jgi:hypothetical protein